MGRPAHLLLPQRATFCFACSVLFSSPSSRRSRWRCLESPLSALCSTLGKPGEASTGCLLARARVNAWFFRL
uniref:Putative secreted protein n=1 Tax=Ixodes ricinus TaxID=34613 RepID=A0A6B0U237_IXORI